MVNYRCNAACRHCLYACSPTRQAGYISGDKTSEICNLLVKNGIGSVHIGGGEPFLDFKGLLGVIRCLSSSNIQLDYIETNAFWAKGPSSMEHIRILKEEGVEALCISTDPFHAEHVPWNYPLELAGACEKQGLGYFLWKNEFVRFFSGLEKNKKYSRKELDAFSPGYIGKTAAAYGIRSGGRAVNIQKEYGNMKPIEDLPDSSSCTQLLSTGHFHVDKDGFFIPPGCTGLRLPLDELTAGTEQGKFPVFEALYTGGITALYRLALEHGFIQDPGGYSSKCSLCFYIRSFLAPLGFLELDENFYSESLKYY